jgi:hypothetical protein
MKGKNISFYCFAILLQIPVPFTYGQTNNLKDPSYESVYVQTDRSEYFTDEPILFNAFILNDLSSHYKAMSDTLLIAVIDQDGLEVASGEFPVSNYMTTGHLMLSKYLTDGNYVLIAGSKKSENSSPDKIFSKIIEVKTSKNQTAGIDLKLRDSIYAPGSTLTANIRFSGKNGEPISTLFTYQLSDSRRAITNGKGKSKEDGNATINILLPEFQSNDTLKLIVDASIKGNDMSCGVVIPTPFNNIKPITYSGKNMLTGSNRQLNIRINTDRHQYDKDEEVKADITITDNQGNPVVASLSVSASNFYPSSPPVNENQIITCSNLNSSTSGAGLLWCHILSEMNKNVFPEIKNVATDEKGEKSLFDVVLRKSLARGLTLFNQSPGHGYIVQEKNDIKKIQKKQASAEKAKQSGYTADRNILDIINRIKPFQILGGEIKFSNVGNFSINNQKGALIVIDGIKMGTDVSVLNSIPITDIARINASTNPSDIQKYSAMNSSGVVEIFMKKGVAGNENDEDRVMKKSSTFFWKTDISTDTSGKASVNFSNNDKPSDVILTVQGITTDGLTGNYSIHYTVK